MKQTNFKSIVHRASCIVHSALNSALCIQHSALRLALLFVLMLGVGNVWGKTKSGEWDLSLTSGSWNATGNATYFSQPYGYKSKDGTLMNNAISDFSTTAGITQIKVGFKCLQNGGTSSKLTIYLVDKNGNTIGSGQEVTPPNQSAASKTSYQYATFTSNFAGATGFKMQVTTFGKNILINGANYEITYTESTKTAVSVAAKSGTHEVTVGGETLDVSTIFTITPESGTYDGTPSYEITEGSSYATLDGSTLTAVAAGTVKVKCTAPETTNFQSGNATATVTVNPKVCSKSITITKGTPSNGSFDLSQTGSVCVDDANASVDVTSISPDEHYHFKKITATNGSVDDTNKKVTNISANTTINVEFEEDAKYDITFVDNLQGTASIPSTTNNKITVYDGEAFTFPTIQDKTAKTTGTCEEVHYHFMGWALSTLTDPIAVDDIKTGTSDAVTAEATYKAVWAKEKTE